MKKGTELFRVTQVMRMHNWPLYMCFVKRELKATKSKPYGDLEVFQILGASAVLCRQYAESVCAALNESLRRSQKP